MYLVLSALSSSPISLVAVTKASAFSFKVCLLPPSIITYTFCKIIGMKIPSLNVVYIYLAAIPFISTNMQVVGLNSEVKAGRLKGRDENLPLSLQLKY